MSATPARAGRESLLGRLAAWWEGAEQEPAPDALSVRVDGAPRPASSAEVDLRSWSAERVEIAQLLYGPGWTSPGGDTLYVELLKTVPLSAGDSVLLHGAALGGLGRTMVRASDAWVEAQESNPLLAAEAARQVKAAGLAKKMRVIAAPLAGCGIKPGSRHAAVSLETLHRTEDKQAELAALRALLKPGGQLLLTDFVRKEAGPEALGRWARCEAASPHLVTAAELKAMLEAQGFGVRVFEDRSQDYCRVAVTALQSLLRSIETSPVRAGLRGWLVWEIEVLTHKLQALDSGAIGFQRAFALAPARRIDR